MGKKYKRSAEEKGRLPSETGENLHRVQVELEDSRNRYHDLYNFAPVGYFTLNEWTIILDVNLTGTALLGFEKKFLIGKRFTQFIAPRNYDVFYSYRKRLLESDSRHSCELEMLKKDATSFYSRLDGIAVFNSEGDFVHFRITILDITEQSKSRERLDKALDELEIKVQERTKSLLKTNEALRIEISERKNVEHILKESLVQLSKKNRYETIISAVTQAVHKSINLQEVLENAVDSMIKNIDGADLIGIYLVEGEDAVLKAHRAFPDWYVERTKRIPYPKGYTWKTIREGRFISCGDVDKDKAIGPAGREIGTKSYLSMPIFFEDSTVGCININSFQKNAFDEEELKLMEVVTGQIKEAINNAKQVERLEASYERINRKNKKLEILNAITQSVHQSFDLSEIYKLALDKVIELENVDIACIYLVSESRSEAVLQDYRNLPEDYIRRAGRIPFPRGLTWKVINTGRVLNIEEAEKDPDIGPAGRDLGKHSALGIPILIEREVVGVIWFGSCKEHKFNDKEINFLSTVGNQIAIAIAKAKQTEEIKETQRKLEERNSNLSILSQISQAVHQSVDLNRINKTILNVVKDLKFIDLISLYFVEGEGDKREAVLQIHSGYPKEYLKRASRIPYPKGNTWKVIESGESVFYEDASDPSTPVGQAGKALGRRSLLSIPIKSGGKVIGVIDFSSFTKHSFSDQELDFLFSLGNQIGTAITKARMFEEIKQRKKALKESFAQLSKKNRYETIIGAVTRSVHQSINLQDVLENAVEAMSQNIDKVNNVSIFLVEGGEAVLRSYRGYSETYVKRVRRISYPMGVTWKVIIEGKPIYCEDVDKDKFIGAAGREFGTKSYASMPISLKDRTVGVINVNSIEKNAFEAEELKLLEIVAGQIEIAINNAREAEALRWSEERYRSLFDQSPVGVFIFDKNFKISECNERMVEILQSSREKIVGLNMQNLRDQSFMPLMKKALKGETCQKEGFYEATTSSAKLWLYVRVTPLRDADGNVTDGMAVVEDITKPKQAEKALRENERRFQSFMDSSSAVTWMKDERGRYVYLNKAFEQVFNVQLADWQGKTDFEIWPENLAKQYREHDLAVLAANSPLQFNETSVNSDGLVHHWIVFKFPFRDLDEQKFTGGVAFDITDLKEAEEALKEYSERLQNLSHRLLEVQETERRYLAIELHDEIGQVLTAVKINLQALEGLMEANLYVPRLKESVSVVDRALEQIRDLSLSLRPSMLDDLGLVATLRWYIGRQAQLGGFTPKFTTNQSEVRFSANLETVCFRTAQEALTNILRHADAKKVSVKLKQYENTLELVVRDDGVGFDFNAAQERISRGLSFGLLGMQERVQLVGGKIEIKSKQNKGTVIRAYFPLSF